MILRRRLSLMITVAFVAVAGTLSLLAVLNGSASARANTAPFVPRYVATTGNDSLNDCDSKSAPCRTIQHAVDRAYSTDSILVATGVYSDLHRRPVPPGYFAPPADGVITQVVYITKSVTILGGYDKYFTYPPDPTANPVTLTAQNKGRVIVLVGNTSPTIRGLRMSGGNAMGLGGGWGSRDAGGGAFIISATATLDNNRVFQNAAYNGGGLYLYRSAATLANNTITANTADWQGGGIVLYWSDPTLEGNVVTSNTAVAHGGGLYLNYSNASINGNTIATNTAEYGGGAFLDWYSAATLDQNTVAANTAHSEGGGLRLNQSDAIFNRNTILSNTADNGGGLYLSDSDSVFDSNSIMSNTAYYGGGLYLKMSDPALTNTIIANNRASTNGSGLYITWRSSPRLLHTTIACNRGSGIYVTNQSSSYSAVAMTNTILVSHTVGITATAGNTATLEATLWYSNTKDGGGAGATITGTHNYWGDPRLAADGYHLMDGSSAINNGVNAGVTTDVDGDSRPDCVLVDIGADEYQGLSCQRIYLPVVMRN